jgi:hypothetical protein
MDTVVDVYYASTLSYYMSYPKNTPWLETPW